MLAVTAWQQRLVDASLVLGAAVAALTALGWLLARPPLLWGVRALRWVWDRSGGVLVGAIGDSLGRWMRHTLGADERDQRLDRIERELRPNGGTSLRDAADRAELRAATTDKRLSTYITAEHQDRVERQEVLDGRLASIDERLEVGDDRMARIEARLWPPDPDDTDGET